MNVTGDRTVEHGLATIGYDDEGVQTQSWDIVRNGVLVGYQLDRPMGHMKPEALNGGPLQRLRLRRLPRPHPDPADGQRVAAARRGRPEHRGADRPGRARALRRRRQVLVDRHAAVQLPVHRPAVLQDHQRRAHRPGPRRRLPGHDDRLLGRDGGGRRPADVGAAAAPSTAARRSPARSPRSATAARPRCSATSASSTPPRRPASELPARHQPAVARRARARHVDGRRLRRDRPRRDQRQPAVGQQHADHQRRDARRARLGRLVRQAGRRGLGRLGQRQRQHPGPGRRAGPRPPTPRRAPPRPPRTPTSWSRDRTSPDWADEPASTDIHVYDDVAPALGEAFGRAGAAGRVLYGFVEPRGDHDLPRLDHRAPAAARPADRPLGVHRQDRGPDPQRLGRRRHPRLHRRRPAGGRGGAGPAAGLGQAPGRPRGRPLRHDPAADRGRRPDDRRLLVRRRARRVGGPVGLQPAGRPAPGSARRSPGPR